MALVAAAAPAALPRLLDAPIANPSVFLDAASLARRLSRLHPGELGPEPLLAVGEYARFMELKIRRRDFEAELFSPSPLVDLVWHCHLLDTRDYLRFCTRACGNFIHHNADGDIDRVARAERYRRTFEAYRSTFNALPDPRFWPAPEEPQRKRPADIAAQPLFAQPDAPVAAPAAASALAAAPASKRRRERNDTCIFVKTLTGKTISLSLPHDATIRDLVDQIYAKEGIPQDQIRLLYGGKQINPTGIDNSARNRAAWARKLSAFNIQDGVTLHLVIRLVGC